MSMSVGSITAFGLSEEAGISLNTLRMKMELAEGFRCRLRNVNELCDLVKHSVSSDDSGVQQTLAVFSHKLNKKQRDFFRAEGIVLAKPASEVNGLSYRGSRRAHVKNDSLESKESGGSGKKSGRIYRGTPV